ncbi:FdrA protein [Thermocatellispora tengchongensis]|uniref:FdrA protein n=1 Tax=Thermocatellispora tengchongensis TaxID=1073253 RepID=A0A840P0T8_9ACTN|nr:FdrA family protein [Thermocatellispora tengchongensis]MBB5131070.1 FdrA protein [Thermocatellispora tengchongensis]
MNGDNGDGELVLVRAGVYHDSVSLMRVSRTLSAMPGVDIAIVAMATELNLGLAAELGFAVPPAEPADLLVAIRAADAAAASAAREELDRLLAALGRPASSGPGGAADPPRTVRAAARGHDATLALVSVPGEHAFAEALDAVEAGLSVMVFSDNVPVEREIALKERAAERGVLVMGPDCGTAVIGGVGLGFANVLRPGPVGVVAASGTGAQQVTCLLDEAGAGVSHVLGVGGRDLSAEVGGRSTLRALAALDEDPATELIVLISKPPAPEVAGKVRAAAERLATPVVTALLDPSGDDLTAAAEKALRALGASVPSWPAYPAPGDRPGAYPGGLYGLYSGGTLCTEARFLAGRGEFTDFGDDAYTRGRPHPMIDPALRLEALAAVPGGAVALLDVVLGHAADPDPAAALAPAVADAVARGTAVVVALIGTAGDPQGRDRQVAALTGAGASVFASNAEAARYAVSLLGPGEGQQTGGVR